MIKAFQWDLARQVERLDWLAEQLPRYADWGYTELYLHLEDAVEYPSLPGVARTGAFSHRQLGALVEAAGRVGIATVPIVNLLGHTQYLVRVPALRDLNELRGPDGKPLARGQICPVHPRTLEVAGRLLRDMAPFCTGGKVHVGLDESFHLGQHPLSRAEIRRIGLAAHFAGYVGRLKEIADTLGLRLGYWADMLYFLPGAIRLLPRGTIAYDWYYYPFASLPRVEIFNFAGRDLSGPLQARGIEYWGCPMNSGFRHEPLPIFGERLANIRSWWHRCRRQAAGGMLVTSWETSRMPAEIPAVVDAAAASLWLGPSGEAIETNLARGFMRMYGDRRHSTSAPGLWARASARAALAADRAPFCGYARWEVNDRWDVCAGQSPAPYARELRALEKLLQTPALPAAFLQGLKLRRYFAQRDVFARRAAKQVFAVRRQLAQTAASSGGPGLSLARLQREARAFARCLSIAARAAEAGWRLTRRKSWPSANRTMLQADRARLRAWQAWLARTRRRPHLSIGSSPMCGAWQLEFTVLNFAPALQKVVVLRGAQPGKPVEVRSRFLMEFRAAAARPTARIRRVFVAPLDHFEPSLRISVRGVGAVRVHSVVLTDGVRRLVPLGWTFRTTRTLGTPAPSRGLPIPDWDADLGKVDLRWST